MDHTYVNFKDDKQLVSRVLNGEASAFEEVIRSTERIVAHIVLRLIANPEDRKDLVQDIYLKAYKQLRVFRFESRLSTWIARIAYTTCIDHLKKKKPLFTDAGPDHETTNENIAREADFRLLGATLHREIESLAPTLRMMIMLFHQADMSYAEIAVVTGMPMGTVKSYLFRARKALRDSLLKKYNMEDLL